MVGLGFTMSDKESDSDAPRQFEKKMKAVSTVFSQELKDIGRVERVMGGAAGYQPM